MSSAPVAPVAKPPAAVAVAGALLIVVAMLTLCGAGMYVVKPEEALGGNLLQPVFEVSAARHAYYLSLFLWIALAALEIVAGAMLLRGIKLGRRLALIWAWGATGGFVLMLLLNVFWVVPALDDAGLAWSELIRTTLAAPAAGCCPVVTAIAMLAVLYNDKVAAWARPAP